jgi:hypothetical protein
MTLAVHNGKYWVDDVKNYLRGKSTLSNSLNHIGIELTETAQGIFGDSGKLKSNSPTTQRLKGGKNTPLVDSGELRDAWTWKIDLSSHNY